jgi:hypothetical protein
MEQAMKDVAKAFQNTNRYVNWYYNILITCTLTNPCHYFLSVKNNLSDRSHIGSINKKQLLHNNHS